MFLFVQVFLLGIFVVKIRTYYDPILFMIQYHHLDMPYINHISIEFKDGSTQLPMNYDEKIVQ
jgi:hypothetical protein